MFRLQRFPAIEFYAIENFILHFNLRPCRRKRAAREAHSAATFAKTVHGLRAKLYNKKRHAEKIQMKKT